MGSVPAARLVSAGLLVVAAVALLAGGAAVGLSAARSNIPPTLAGGDPPRFVPAESQDFDDSRQVELTLTAAQPQTIDSRADGVVTKLSCRAGSLWQSGDSPLAINDIPVLLLHTQLPLWRPLMAGQEGNDVRAVQSELRRLNYAVPDSGRMDAPTVRALRKIVGQSSTLSPSKLGAGGQPLPAVWWLPAGSLKIGSCAVRLGATVTTGQQLVAAPAGLAAVAVKQLPADAAPGRRVLRLGSREIPVTAEGTVTSPEDIEAIEATPIAQLNRRSKGDVPLTATWALAQPLRVAVVPPSAVTSVQGQAGCLQGPNGAIAVTIVSSALGRALVTPATEQIPASVRLHPDENVTCR